MESEQHVFAKSFVYGLLTHGGLAAQIEKKMYREVDVGLGQIQLFKWTFDVAGVGFRYPNDYEKIQKPGLVVRKLDVEIDNYESGGGHGKGRQAHDAFRDAFFMSEGWEVYRFPLSYFNRRKLDKEMEKAFKKELKLN